MFFKNHDIVAVMGEMNLFEDSNQLNRFTVSKRSAGVYKVCKCNKNMHKNSV